MRTVGIKLADGSFYPIMEEGSAQKKTLELTTAHNNQTCVMVDLYRSKTCSMEDAEYIDTLKIDNLVEHPNGEPSISFDVGLDENGELSASIADPETGATSNSEITLVSRTVEERLQADDYSIAEDSGSSGNAGAVAAGAAVGAVAGAGLMAAAMAKNDSTEEALPEDVFTLGDDSAFEDTIPSEEPAISDETMVDAAEAEADETVTEDDFAMPDDTVVEEEAPVADDATIAEDDFAMPDDTVVEEEAPVADDTTIAEDDFSMPEETVVEEEAPVADDTTIAEDDFSMPEDTFAADDTVATDEAPAEEDGFAMADDDFSMPEDTTVVEDSAAPTDETVADDDFALPDEDFSVPDGLTDDSEISESSGFAAEDPTPAPAAEGLNFAGLYDKETEMGNSSENQEDDFKKKTRAPVIICVVCAIICLIATLLVLLVLPTKFNLRLKHSQKTKEPAAIEKTAEKPAPVEEKKPDPVPQAKEDEVVVIEKAEEVKPVPPPPAETKPKGVTYKIKWGDTLWDLADTYYKNPWRYKKIASYNNIKNPDHIISGTIITIPAE